MLNDGAQGRYSPAGLNAQALGERYERAASARTSRGGAPARRPGGFLVVVAAIVIPAFSLTRYQLWEHQFIAVI